MVTYIVNNKKFQAADVNDLVSQLKINPGIATAKVISYEATKPVAVYDAPYSIDSTGITRRDGVELDPKSFKQRITFVTECVSKILPSLGEVSIQRDDFWVENQEVENLVTPTV